MNGRKVDGVFFRFVSALDFFDSFVGCINEINAAMNSVMMMMNEFGDDDEFGVKTASFQAYKTVK